MVIKWISREEEAEFPEFNSFEEAWTFFVRKYDKNMILWFYAKNKPNHQFNIALDEDVLRFYIEYDRMVKADFEGKLDDKNSSFDTVRATFMEGEPIYPTSAFYTFTHTQICVRNLNCIKAVFDPRKPDRNYPIP